MSDYENALKIGKARVGAEALYFKAGFKSVTLPYAELERAFIRVREANGKMCCGTACFADYYLVLVSGGNELAEIRMERDEAEKILKLISEKSPATAIGIAQ